jgi:hypothetical protein
MADIAQLAKAKSAVETQHFIAAEAGRAAESALAALQARHDATRTELAEKETQIDELTQSMSTDQRTAAAREGEDKAHMHTLETRVAELEVALLVEQHAHEDDNHTRDEALTVSERKYAQPLSLPLTRGGVNLLTLFSPLGTDTAWMLA